MSQKLSGIVSFFLLTMITACSQSGTFTNTGEGNTPPATPVSTSSDILPSSPGAMLKKFLETLSNKDAEWYVKYTKAVTAREATRRKGEPPLTEGQIRNSFAFLTSSKGTKPTARSFEISRETINGNKSTVSIIINRVDGTTETKEFVLTKIDGMWIIGDFPAVLNQ